QVSRKPTVRLNTGRPGAESGSRQKYPSRSNCTASAALSATAAGSSLQSCRTSSDFALISLAKAALLGLGLRNSGLESRTSAPTASAAETQCSVACTLRPSGGVLPPRV